MPPKKKKKSKKSKGALIPEEDTDANTGGDKLTLKELKKTCKDRGIPTFKLRKKSDLKEEIRKYDQRAAKRKTDLDIIYAALNSLSDDSPLKRKAFEAWVRSIEVQKSLPAVQLPSLAPEESEWESGATYAYVLFEACNVEVKETAKGEWISDAYVVVKIGKAGSGKLRPRLKNDQINSLPKAGFHHLASASLALDKANTDEDIVKEVRESKCQVVFIIPGQQHESPVQEKLSLAKFKRNKPKVPPGKKIDWTGLGVKSWIGITAAPGHTDWVVMKQEDVDTLRQKFELGHLNRLQDFDGCFEGRKDKVAQVRLTHPNTTKAETETWARKLSFPKLTPPTRRDY